MWYMLTLLTERDTIVPVNNTKHLDVNFKELEAIVSSYKMRQKKDYFRKKEFSLMKGSPDINCVGVIGISTVSGHKFAYDTYFK